MARPTEELLEERFEKNPQLIESVFKEIKEKAGIDFNQQAFLSPDSELKKTILSAVAFMIGKIELTKANQVISNKMMRPGTEKKSTIHSSFEFQQKVNNLFDEPKSIGAMSADVKKLFEELLRNIATLEEIDQQLYPKLEHCEEKAIQVGKTLQEVNQAQQEMEVIEQSQNAQVNKVASQITIFNETYQTPVAPGAAKVLSDAASNTVVELPAGSVNTQQPAGTPSNRLAGQFSQVAPYQPETLEDKLESLRIRVQQLKQNLVTQKSELQKESKAAEDIYKTRQPVAERVDYLRIQLSNLGYPISPFRLSQPIKLNFKNITEDQFDKALKIFLGAKFKVMEPEYSRGFSSRN